MNSMNITNARNNLYEIADKVIANSEIFNISTKNGDIVLLSAENFSAIQETLYLMGNKTVREDILEGLKTPVEDCVEVDLDCIK